MADAGVQQSLLQGRARRGQKHILQHLHGQIQLRVQGIAHGLIIGQIGIILFAFLSRNGISLYNLPHFCEGRLSLHLGINGLIIVMAQILFIQPLELLSHIAVSI